MTDKNKTFKVKHQKISCRPLAVGCLIRQIDKNKKRFVFQIVLFVIALQICAVIAAVEMDLYEPVEEACKRCNCTSKNGTIESREHGKFFTLDCTMKNFQRLFTGWPGEAGDNSTGN